MFINSFCIIIYEILFSDKELIFVKRSNKFLLFEFWIFFYFKNKVKMDRRYLILYFVREGCNVSK